MANNTSLADHLQTTKLTPIVKLNNYLHTKKIYLYSQSLDQPFRCFIIALIIKTLNRSSIRGMTSPPVRLKLNN